MQPNQYASNDTQNSLYAVEEMLLWQCCTFSKLVSTVFLKRGEKKRVSKSKGDKCRVKGLREDGDVE